MVVHTDFTRNYEHHKIKVFEMFDDEEGIEDDDEDEVDGEIYDTDWSQVMVMLDGEKVIDNDEIMLSVATVIQLDDGRFC